MDHGPQIMELWPLNTPDVLLRVRWADMAWRGNKYQARWHHGIMLLRSRGTWEQFLFVGDHISDAKAYAQGYLDGIGATDVTEVPFDLEEEAA